MESNNYYFRVFSGAFETSPYLTLQYLPYLTVVNLSRFGLSVVVCALRNALTVRSLVNNNA